VTDKKVTFVFDYNSPVSSSIFTHSVPLETGMNTLQLFIVYLPSPLPLFFTTHRLESRPPNDEVIHVYYHRVLSENFTLFLERFKLLLKNFWKSTCLFLESPDIY